MNLCHIESISPPTITWGVIDVSDNRLNPTADRAVGPTPTPRPSAPGTSSADVGIAVRQPLVAGGGVAAEVERDALFGPAVVPVIGLDCERVVPY